MHPYEDATGVDTPTSSSGADLLSVIIETLDANKAEDINVIDLKGKSSIADTMVIATGASTRQVAALTDYVARAIKSNSFGVATVEGLEQADWVLLDAGSVIVHIFRPEVRSFYNLDKMWSTDIEKADSSTETLN